MAPHDARPTLLRIIDTLKRFPTLAMTATPLLRSKIKELTEDTRKNEDFDIDLVDRHISRASSRKDFMTRVLEQRDTSKMSDAADRRARVGLCARRKRASHGPVGHHLLPTADTQGHEEVPEGNPQDFQDVQRHQLQVDSGSAVPRCCNQEGLMIYPSLPIALPRVVREGGDTVARRHMRPKQSLPVYAAGKAAVCSFCVPASCVSSDGN
jgi:hypothetical protein